MADMTMIEILQGIKNWCVAKLDGKAASSHTHGNVANDGKIASTEVTSATGVLVYDSNNKIQRATAEQARSIIGAGTSSFSGSYTDLTNKPTIPAAQIQADWNQTNAESKDYIKNKPSTMGASGTNHAAGLVPDPGATAGTSKFLREDGSWQNADGGNADKIDGYHISVVSSMPASPAADTIYIVK